MSGQRTRSVTIRLTADEVRVASMVLVEAGEALTIAPSAWTSDHGILCHLVAKLQRAYLLAHRPPPPGCRDLLSNEMRDLLLFALRWEEGERIDPALFASLGPEQQPAVVSTPSALALHRRGLMACAGPRHRQDDDGFTLDGMVTCFAFTPAGRALAHLLRAAGDAKPPPGCGYWFQVHAVSPDGITSPLRGGHRERRRVPVLRLPQAHLEELVHAEVGAFNLRASERGWARRVVVGLGPWPLEDS